mgnify:CR=1 FL=1
MSWLSRNAELRREDWGLLDFDPSPSEAFVILKRRGPCQSEENGNSDADRVSNQQTNRKTLASESDLDQWLTEVSDDFSA